MTVFTPSGTILTLSADAPATLDEEGYDAITYTEIGEVGDLGDIPTPVYDAVAWATVTERGEYKSKGGYSLGSQTVTVAIDPDDAGQALVDAATLDDELYTVKIEHPDLGIIFGRALVNGGPRLYGDTGTISTRQITFEYVDILVTEGIPAGSLTIGGNPITINGKYITVGV